MRFTVPSGLQPWLPLLVGACVASLLVGVGVGRLLPTGSAPSPAGSGAPSVAADGHIHGATGDGAAPGADVGGLSLSGGGYTLVPDRTDYAADDEPQELAFTIVDDKSEPVTEFATVHDKPLHLFLVRRDLTGYQHLHPEPDLDTGRWHAAVLLDEPGDWRAIADFTVAGSTPVAVTLGVDLTVPGEPREHELPTPADTATVDGFTVSLDVAPVVGVAEPLLATVTRDGAPVDLDPYLGAYGHLVLLRDGDVGFGHVHPDPEPVGEALRFWWTVPSAGRYVGYLDFQVDGTVHTAQFTVDV